MKNRHSKTQKEKIKKTEKRGKEQKMRNYKCRKKGEKKPEKKKRMTEVMQGSCCSQRVLKNE